MSSLLFILLVILIIILALIFIKSGGYIWISGIAGLTNPDEVNKMIPPIPTSDISNTTWSDNIESLTRDNKNWRTVLYTSPNLQVVTMSTPVGQELGREIHPSNDQFFRVESGTGELIIYEKDGAIRKTIALSDGVAAVVPYGIYHNVKNTGSTPLQFYTIYGPPHHPPGTIDVTHENEIARESKK